ncbi:hypothetical protein TISLANDTSLP1_17750 [Thermodesulfovibrio yellowstonii]|uniref:Uncharacterized protein n=1 Tax=Thermodesulfovibrio yellowstonii TaxID=28262 RepID=A0A9W6GHH1_9BACT|nr:hypothetical protein TISLANDTSLP1_17750 [Thermodesulfovibrio islandicus]
MRKTSICQINSNYILNCNSELPKVAKNLLFFAYEINKNKRFFTPIEGAQNDIRG